LIVIYLETKNHNKTKQNIISSSIRKIEKKIYSWCYIL